MLIAALFFAYMPGVLLMNVAATSVTLPGPLQAVWEGLAPTLGLQIMVAMLPTILLLIFRGFFKLNADAFAQHRLQNTYFWFQIVFVVLVTAINGDVLSFAEM